MALASGWLEGSTKRDHIVVSALGCAACERLLKTHRPDVAWT